MKIICLDSPTRFFVKSDTTLLRNNEPFFEPNFGTKFEVIDGMAIKITRIVKCIEVRFAHRAWDEWFLCSEHRATDIDEQLGRNFDRSFAVNPDIQSKITLSQAEQHSFDQAISFISEYISLRIGDYIFIPNK